MNQCDKCHKTNRPQSRFCRFCGAELTVAPAVSSTEPVTVADNSDTGPATDLTKDALQSLIALETAKKAVRDLVGSARHIVKSRGKAALKSLNINILITGPSGSGKSTLLDAVTKLLTDKGLITADSTEKYTSLNIDDLDLTEKPLSAIVIDEANRLLPADSNDDLTGTPLEYVFEHAKPVGASGQRNLIVLMAGNQQLQDYIDARPELSNMFALNIRLPGYTPTEVAAICRHMLSTTHHVDITPEAFDKLTGVLNYERRNSDQFGNAHLAVSKANDLLLATARPGRKGRSQTVLPDDITGKVYVPKTLDEVMKEFDKYVGVDEIKDTMTGIVDSIRAFRRRHPDRTYELADHYLFTGNPGTGKTTMARVFADALSAMGILPSGQLVEVAPKDLKGMYQGHTGPQVDAAFDRAMGGVLFIDEAYDMWGGEGDTFGNEAVTALIKNVEDRRGKLVVILAGYPLEMDNFANANPGIRSRFNVTVPFRDYKAPELTEIARRMIASKGYTLSEDCDKALGKFFEKMYAARGKDFANAREVRNAVEKAIRTQNTRIRKASELPGFDPTQEFVLSLADFTGESERSPLTIDEVLTSMDDLIGMADIKQEIRRLGNVAMVNRLRMERGIGGASLQPINIILTGNPGTGKTTIAKRMGQVLHAAGVLPTDKVIEREAKTLLSSYVNASGQNMDRAVDEAMGGVLFIDEAYNLLPQPGSMNNTGNEALDALMTRMENDKGKFVVVIAGYADRMQQLVRRGNPGLMSRFNKRFHIPDYDAEELFEIFKLNVAKRGLTLTAEATEAVRRRIDHIVADKGPNFGNAREVVNLLNEVVELQGERLAGLSDLFDADPAVLTTIQPGDIPS